MQRTFLVGCPRSGTTLLQSLLASHTKIVSFPETHLLSRTIPIHRFSQFFKIYSPRTFQLLEQQLTHLGLSRKDIDLPERTRFKTRDWIKIILENIDALAQQKAASGETHWLEKTPRHLQYATLMHETDPSVKFIHIIRRGEHVVPSLYFATRQNPGEWGGARSIRKCVYWWKRSVKLSSRFLNTPNHIHISYERLVENPEQVLEVIFDFLDLPYEQNVLNEYHKTAESLIEESEKWKQKNMYSRISKSDKLNKLTKADQEYINKQLYNFPYGTILNLHFSQNSDAAHDYV